MSTGDHHANDEELAVVNTRDETERPEISGLVQQIQNGAYRGGENKPDDAGHFDATHQARLECRGDRDVEGQFDCQRPV